MDRWQSNAFTSPEAARMIKRDLLEGLKYTHHSLFDWRPFPNQRLPTVEINSFGLRSTAEFRGDSWVRCAVIGGSFAWGFGASSNEHTPASQISTCLTKRTGRPVDVVSLADQNYCSIQEIKAFMFCVDEVQPDVVLCITGVNDIGRGYVDAFKRDPRYVAASEFLNWGIQVGLMSGRINDVPRWKKIAKVLLRDRRIQSYPGDDFFTLSKPAQEDIPHTLQRQKIDLLTAVCSQKGIRLVFVLQPLMHWKKVLSEYENGYRQDGESTRPDYVKFYQHHHSIMRAEFENRGASSDGPIFLDSSSFLDSCEESAFFDGMHLSDRGYSIWSDELCRRLMQLLDWPS